MLSHLHVGLAQSEGPVCHCPLCLSARHTGDSCLDAPPLVRFEWREGLQRVCHLQTDVTHANCSESVAMIGSAHVRSVAISLTWFAADTSASFSFTFSSSCGHKTCASCCCVHATDPWPTALCTVHWHPEVPAQASCINLLSLQLLLFAFRLLHRLGIRLRLLHLYMSQNTDPLYSCLHSVTLACVKDAPMTSDTQVSNRTMVSPQQH